MTMKTPTKVWPLETGVRGYTAQGNPIDLQPGMPGWMDMDDAKVAEEAGSVDIMVGKTPLTLRKPGYRSATIKAEDPSSKPSKMGETSEESPAVPPKPPMPPTSKRKYRRRDVKAEDT